jgi:hypothetical protein
MEGYLSARNSFLATRKEAVADEMRQKERDIHCSQISLAGYEVYVEVILFCLSSQLQIPAALGGSNCESR